MSKKLRAKFYCNSVTDHGYSEEVNLTAVSGKDDDNSENNQFAQATPSGEHKMWIDNPDAKGFFKPQKSYYLDFTEAPE